MTKQVLLFFYTYSFLGVLLSSCTSTIPTSPPNSNFTFINHYDATLDSLYQLKQPITIIDKVSYRKKEGHYIGGIYLENKTSKNQFVELKGTLKRKPYPRAYYSTNESPQGCFGDTSVIHYRLVFESYEILRTFPIQQFKGQPINIKGSAAFIYEFADSEPYFLDKHTPWKEEELNQTIELTAVLIQFIEGKSVLKDWEIISSTKN